MKQGTLKTLGMVALGAAAVVAGGGNASAASGSGNTTSIDRLAGTVIGSLEHQQQLGQKAVKQLAHSKVGKTGKAAKHGNAGKTGKAAKKGKNTKTIKTGTSTKNKGLLGGLPVNGVQTGDLTSGLLN